MSEPTKEQLAAWEEWLADRPPVIQDLARRFPPWAWFRLKDEPARLYVYHAVAFFEDGTLRMAKYSVATGEGIIQVFGIKPDDLEPCGSPDEEREGMGPAEEARGVVLASLERAIHDRRLAELEENPDAPPTTPMRALADYLTEATESAPWVLTNDDGEEIMRGTGLRFHEDGSFSVEETPPAPEPSEEP